MQITILRDRPAIGDRKDNWCTACCKFAGVVHLLQNEKHPVMHLCLRCAVAWDGSITKKKAAKLVAEGKREEAIELITSWLRAMV